MEFLQDCSFSASSRKRTLVILLLNAARHCKIAGIRFVLYLCFALVLYLCSICALYVLYTCSVCAWHCFPHALAILPAILLRTRRRRFGFIAACGGPRAGVLHYGCASGRGRHALRAQRSSLALEGIDAKSPPSAAPVVPRPRQKPYVYALPFALSSPECCAATTYLVDLFG